MTRMADELLFEPLPPSAEPLERDMQRTINETIVAMANACDDRFPADLEAQLFCATQVHRLAVERAIREYGREHVEAMQEAADRSAVAIQRGGRA